MCIKKSGFNLGLIIQFWPKQGFRCHLFLTIYDENVVLSINWRAVLRAPCFEITPPNRPPKQGRRHKDYIQH